MELGTLVLTEMLTYALLLQLWAADAVAALHFLEVRQQRAAGLGNVGAHGLALRLKAKAGTLLAIRGNAQVADVAGRGRSHPIALVTGSPLCPGNVLTRQGQDNGDFGNPSEILLSLLATTFFLGSGARCNCKNACLP